MDVSSKYEDVQVSFPFSNYNNNTIVYLKFQYFVVQQLLGYLPRICIGPLSGFDAPTFLFTNIPGGPQVNCLENCVMEKFIGIAPNIKGMGKERSVMSRFFLTFSLRNKFHCDVIRPQAAYWSFG